VWAAPRNTKVPFAGNPIKHPGEDAPTSTFIMDLKDEGVTVCVCSLKRNNWRVPDL
jgi:hypothetical protein